MTGIAALRCLALAWLCAALAGCASLTGYPQRSYDPKADLAALARWNQASVIEDYASENPAARGNLSRLDYRNEIVSARMATIDLHFIEFQRQLYAEGVGTDMFTDFMVLMLGGLGTVTGSASTKASFSAAVTGFTGANGSFNKNAYFERSIPALLAKMEARRKEALLPILTGLGRSVSDYPLSKALADLAAYEGAGTIPGAIVGITKTAGMEADEADKQIQILRNSEFLKKSNVDRVQRIAEKIKALSDEAAIRLSKDPPTQDANSERTVRAQDPNDRRSSVGDAARLTLLTRAQVDERSQENLEAWENALGIE